MFLALGTQPVSEEHWFAKLLTGGADYAQVHAVPLSAPPFRVSTWTQANPSMRYMPMLRKAIETEAKRAKQDPAVLAAFKALRLNQGVSDVVESVLLDADTWREIESVTVSPVGQYVLGIDLGGSAAMSAAAAYWPDSGLSDAFAVFPELPSLAERGLADGVGNLYVRCAERGELVQAGARVSDIGALLGEVLERWDRPAAIVCDRWREQELRQHLDAIGFPQAALVTRGMGYRDGADDVRRFRAAALDGHLHPRMSLLMRSCMAVARLVTDPAGNAKLAKGGEGRRIKARDDATAALILAVAEGQRGGRGAAGASVRLSFVS